MRTLQYLKQHAYYYIYAIAFTVLLNFWISSRYTPVSGVEEVSKTPVFVIDAGHGGIDGGTTSCTGVLESTLNLEIAIRLDRLLRLMGYQTVMTRTNQDSIATEGETIRQQKVSDLKKRVAIVEGTSNGVLISIHQNFYPQSQYFGPQVFYAAGNEELGEVVQKSLNRITQAKGRASKKSSGVYLMEHITRPGILVECGFLSNPQEEVLLRQEGYQK